MNNQEKDFSDFCYHMWRENLVERETYNEVLLTYSEYIELNEDFLRKEFNWEVAHYPKSSQL